MTLGVGLTLSPAVKCSGNDVVRRVREIGECGKMDDSIKPPQVRSQCACQDHALLHFPLQVREIPFQQLRFVGFDFDIEFVLRFGRGKRGRILRRVS
jgi:hypothetical protein